MCVSQEMCIDCGFTFNVLVLCAYCTEGVHYSTCIDVLNSNTKQVHLQVGEKITLKLPSQFHF